MNYHGIKSGFIFLGWSEKRPERGPRTITDIVRARALAPRFSVRALETDRTRAPLDETIKDLVD